MLRAYNFRKTIIYGFILIQDDSLVWSVVNDFNNKSN